MRTNWGIAAALLSSLGGASNWAMAVDAAKMFRGGPMLPRHRASGARAHRAWRKRRSAGRA